MAVFLSGKRLAAVEMQRLAGKEAIGQGEHDALLGVVGGSPSDRFPCR
ncbi:MAG TPA: hypothetical protein VE155_04615 [Pseudonocardiaceae bacterium]|jgi:hypothetical protein|nr:hypothetical protein [Pseudonocardiaceae bacterium]